ncbi:MAG: MMPL family transporter [Planctomycetes bacterium]|nr:MMPL family transporter [Planctomycetota bacterium]
MARDEPAPHVNRSAVARLVDALIDYRLVLFPLALVLTAAAWPISQRLDYDRSIESLYASDAPVLKAYRRSKRLFGGDEFALVAYSDPALLDPETRELTPEAERRLRELSAALQRVPGVNAPSTRNLAKAAEPRPVPIPLIGEMRMPPEDLHPLVRRILLGDDDRTTAVVLRLEPEAEARVSRGETIARIRELAADFERRHGLETFVVGEPVQVHDMFRYVDEDGETLFRWSLVLLSAVMVVLFRNPRWVALPLLVVLATVVWTKAILVVSGARLSMVSSMLNSLVTIIGVATVTHVIVQYRLRRQRQERLPAFRETLVEVLPAIFWTCATTAMGFAALLSSEVTPVRSFALMMSLATLLVLLAVAAFVPGGALIGRFAAEPAGAPAEARMVRLLASLAQTVVRHPKSVAAISAAMVAFAGAGFARLEVETDFSRNFRRDSPIVQGLVFVEERLGGAGTWEVNFPAPGELSEPYLASVGRLTQRLRSLVHAGSVGDRSDEGEASQLTRVVSLTDTLEAMDAYVTREFGALTAAFWTRSPLSMKLNLLRHVQPEFVETLYNPREESPGRGRMRIVLRAREQRAAEDKLALIARVERIAQEWARDELAEEFPNSDVEVAGLYVLLAFLIQNLLRDQLVSFLLAATGISLMMTVAFRSLRIGLISLVPNLFPIVLVIGGMGWLGLEINIATAMIASVSMGLTVDFTIHYIAGFRRAQAAGLSTGEALRDTHRGVGRALVFANLALVAGFAVLTLSHFIPLVYFGLLVSAAMVGGLIADLVLLPLLLSRFAARDFVPPLAKGGLGGVAGNNTSLEPPPAPPLLGGGRRAKRPPVGYRNSGGGHYGVPPL